MVSIPVIKNMQEEKRKRDEKLLESSNYLLDVQKELEVLSTELYLQKNWLHENYIDDILEVIQSDKKVLN